ncbi:MAG: thioredoxin fold domain-containing protein [Candidatus Omnitrophica bacterium]|nr:thioredoxin fold domain-containing protein [Candidatus Omnitrophota bacterium]
MPTSGIFIYMNKNLFRTFLLSILVIMILASTAEALQWHRDLDRAIKKASASGKPVLVDFYTDWCGWCKKMDRDTYSNGAVQKEADNFICVKVDGSRHRGLVRKYNIKAYPTTLFLNGRGIPIERIRGYLPPDSMLTKMRAIRSRYKSSTKDKAPSSNGGYRLSGIIFSQDNAKAIINNEIAGVGDTVGGAKITEITQYSVTLSSDKGKVVLELE